MRQFQPCCGYMHENKGSCPFYNWTTSIFPPNSNETDRQRIEYLKMAIRGEFGDKEEFQKIILKAISGKLKKIKSR